MAVDPSNIRFRDKVVCSECNRPLMGKVLIATGGRTLCLDCFEKQAGGGSR
ncbi:hypothetical protein [uncultured Methanospirillum sp.]|uniref:hypothetical protein n=1 Tax=uncultured Methanospirillum sp. TaxID=262503 RepID=UPI0029C81F9F|nr:hypothetical protein [uncultured Methanospirillum sp.]